MISSDEIKRIIRERSQEERLSILSKNNGKTSISDYKRYMVGLDKESLSSFREMFANELTSSMKELAEVLRDGIRPRVQVVHQSTGLTKSQLESSTVGTLIGGYNRIVSGFTEVTTAGTASQIVTASTPISCVVLSPCRGNTGIIAIGDASVSAANGVSQGIILTTTSAPVTIYINDLNKLWVDAAISGDSLSWCYFGNDVAQAGEDPTPPTTAATLQNTDGTDLTNTDGQSLENTV